MIQNNRLLHTIAQNLDTDSQKQARSNINAMVDMSISDSTPINLIDKSTTSSIANELSLSARQFSVTSPVKMTNNILSVDDSTIVTAESLKTKQKMLLSGKNTNVTGSSISAVDTVYTASNGLSMVTGKSPNTYNINMVIASDVARGGVCVNESSSPITLTDGKLSIDSDVNIAVKINTTTPTSPYYSSSEAGYQPQVTKDGNEYTISSAIHWNQLTDSTSSVNPVVEFCQLGSHVGLNVEIDKSSTTVGSAKQPIMLENGSLTAITKGTKDSSWGGGSGSPMYLASGLMRHWNGSIGDEDTVTYLNKGVITKSTASVGNVDMPVYYNSDDSAIEPADGAVTYMAEFNGHNKASLLQYSNMCTEATLNNHTIDTNIADLMYMYGMKNMYFSINTSPTDTETYGSKKTISEYLMFPINVDYMTIGNVYTIGLSMGGEFTYPYFPVLELYSENTGRNGVYMHLYGFVKGYFDVQMAYLYDSSTEERTVVTSNNESQYDSPFFVTYSSATDTMFAPYSVDGEWTTTGTTTTKSYKITDTITRYEVTHEKTYSGAIHSSEKAIMFPLGLFYDRPSPPNNIRFLKIMRGQNNYNVPTLYMMDWG